MYLGAGRDSTLPTGQRWLPDSAPLVRSRLGSLGVDTIATLRIPVDQYLRQPDSKTVRARIDPQTDDWAVLPDGTIAIVRGHDYHVDWIAPDGSVRATPKMPIVWRRLTDSEKQTVADSMSRAWTALQRPGYRAEVLPSDLPEYFPAFRRGSVYAGPDGSLWILPLASAERRAGLVFDVVNRDGAVYQRVSLPVGCDLAGFGRAGALYLRCIAADAVRLERARVAR